MSVHALTPRGTGPGRRGRARGPVRGHNAAALQAGPPSWARAPRGAPKVARASRAHPDGCPGDGRKAAGPRRFAISPCVMERVATYNVATGPGRSAHRPLDKILHRHVIPTSEPERHAELFLLMPACRGPRPARNHRIGREAVAPLPGTSVATFPRRMAGPSPGRRLGGSSDR